MRSLAFEFNIPAILFWMIYLIWCLSEILGSIRHKAGNHAHKQDHGSVSLLIGAFYVGTFFNFASLWWFPAAAITWNRPLLFGISLVLMAAGILLRQRAIITLGRFFTREVAVCSDQAVVQSGPYRFIRHPGYAGTMLTTLGFGLAMTNWASLVLTMLCFFIGHLYRIAVEERALRASLGQAYVEYMRHTRRLIPFVF